MSVKYLCFIKVHISVKSIHLNTKIKTNWSAHGRHLPYSLFNDGQFPYLIARVHESLWHILAMHSSVVLTDICAELTVIEYGIRIPCVDSRIWTNIIDRWMNWTFYFPVCRWSYGRRIVAVVTHIYSISSRIFANRIPYDSMDSEMRTIELIVDMHTYMDVFTTWYTTTQSVYSLENSNRLLFICLTTGCWCSRGNENTTTVWTRAQ